MITWIRTANTFPGKIGEAVQWSKSVVAAVKRVTGKELIVSVSFGGPAGGISWIMQFDNAAQVEEANTKMMADSEYQKILAQAQSYFVPNTGHDQMWRRIQV
jgi:hypothetical protein